MQRLEAARQGARPHCHPGPYRPGDALEVFRPEVLQFEEIAEEPPRALGDDDCIRLGDALQPRREVRGLTDDATLLSFTRADQVADHSEPGRDSNAYLQACNGGCRELWHCFDQGKP